MAPEELRRLARRRAADADALVADANHLRSQAAALDGVLTPLLPMSRQVWAGPAAEDFEANVRSNAARLDAQLLQLRQIASDFERQAVAKRHEAADLEARAAAAEMAAVSVPGAI